MWHPHVASTFHAKDGASRVEDLTSTGIRRTTVPRARWARTLGASQRRRPLGFNSQTLRVYHIYICVCLYVHIYIYKKSPNRKVGNLHRTAILEVLLGICLWATMTGFLVLNHFLRCASTFDCAHQPQFLGMELLPDMTRLRCSYGIDILRTVRTVMICSYQ